MLFKDLQLIQPILKAVAELNYKEATPVQVATIPLALAGRDVIASAQTGTGKTAAFSLPMLQLLFERQDTTKVGLVPIIKFLATHLIFWVILNYLKPQNKSLLY